MALRASAIASVPGAGAPGSVRTRAPRTSPWLHSCISHPGAAWMEMDESSACSPAAGNRNACGRSLQKPVNNRYRDADMPARLVQARRRNLMDRCARSTEGPPNPEHQRKAAMCRAGPQRLAVTAVREPAQYGYRKFRGMIAPVSAGRGSNHVCLRPAWYSCAADRRNTAQVSERRDPIGYRWGTRAYAADIFVEDSDDGTGAATCTGDGGHEWAVPT